MLICVVSIATMTVHMLGYATNPSKYSMSPTVFREYENTFRLLKLRETASLSHLYREVKRLTNIDWYLSEQERRDLARADEIIDQYGNDAVQPHSRRSNSSTRCSIMTRSSRRERVGKQVSQNWPTTRSTS